MAEDLETGEMVGTCAIDAAVGLSQPFYNYHIGKVVHSSPKLGIYNVVETLTLSNDYTGNSELCTLFLRECAREGLNGRLLSKHRFLFMAEHPELFDETVFAEMRGVSDANGHSPFYEWLQTHFFSMDFPTVDYLTGIGKKRFIAELMPKYPIYVNLLSKEARAVIGQTHEKTRPAIKMLQDEGFVNRGYVDIFDAGPTVECDVKNIRSVRRSRSCGCWWASPSVARPTLSATAVSSITAPATAISGSISTSTKPLSRPRWRRHSRCRMATWCGWLTSTEANRTSKPIIRQAAEAACQRQGVNG